MKQIIMHNDEHDTATCYCGDRMSWNQFERIYDDHGCYIGRACTYKCFEENSGMKLHYSRQDCADCGEVIESDY